MDSEEGVKRTKSHVCRAALVIFGGVLVHLTLGTVYTFGNLTPYLTSYIRKYSSPKDLRYEDSVWIFALAGVGQGASMSFGGLLEKRLGPKLSTLFGGLFMSAGVALTYFTVHVSFAVSVLTYGLMFGLGVGIAYAVPMACGMKWLPEKKGLVNGIIVGGFGGGAFIFDQVQTAFINPHDVSPQDKVGGDSYFTQESLLEKVPDVFLLLGGCYAVMQIVGSLLLSNPPEQHDRKEGIYEPEPDGDPASLQQKTPLLIPQKTSNCHESGHTKKKHGKTVPDDDEFTLTPKELFKNKAFYMLWLIFFLNLNAVNFISTLYKAYGQTFIHDDVFLAIVGSFAALFNFAGRIFWGGLADRFSFKTAMMWLCMSFTVLMLTFDLTHFGGKPMFFIWVCLLFGTFSGTFSLMPTACAKCFGLKHYSVNYGILFTANVVVSPISAVITSQLKSILGWNGMFFLTAGSTFISLLLAMVFNVKKNGVNI